MSESELNRRGLFVGGGAALAAGAFAYGAPSAEADTKSPHGDGTSSARVHPHASPVTSTIASAPVSGWTYRTVSMYDFFPFYPQAQRTWGGWGVYSAGTGSPMRATMEIPPGALVRDVEYYIYNNSSSQQSGSAYLFTPGSGFISSLSADASVAPNSGLIAARAATTSDSWGPFPIGARLVLSLSTPTDGTVQINGARVAFSGGAGATGLLNSPVRAYDSRAHDGKIASGATRTITLPASIVGPGTAAVILNVTAVNATAGGYLNIYSAAGSEPTASALNYRGDGSATANGMVVAVSNARQIKIKASSAVQVIVDVTGVIA